MKLFNKKGDIEWSTIGMWVFIILLTFVLLVLLYKFRGKIFDTIKGIIDIFSFGGA